MILLIRKSSTPVQDNCYIMNRQEQVIIQHLGMEHNQLRSHLYTQFKTDMSLMCTFGLVPQMAEHILSVAQLDLLLPGANPEFIACYSSPCILPLSASTSKMLQTPKEGKAKKYYSTPPSKRYFSPPPFFHYATAYSKIALNIIY